MTWCHTHTQTSMCGNEAFFYVWSCGVSACTNEVPREGAVPVEVETLLTRTATAQSAKRSPRACTPQNAIPRGFAYVCMSFPRKA